MLKIKQKRSIHLLVILALLTYSCSTLTDNEIDNEELVESEESVENVLNLTVSSSSSLTASSSSGHHYVGNLEYVLGDVKQAQITNAYNTTSKIDNALDGFEEMGVNGIRIAIFADGVNPNETMYNYFYNEAKSRGFKIFANPAQGGGGARIANGILNGTITSVKNTASKNALVARIKAFAQQYECDWISPFNEDGRPGNIWYSGQMNNIYSELSGQLNGADLVGSCDWGIQSGLLSLQQTTMKNYISVATTHNLGFEHSLWPNYIAEAGSLPVWDSETNSHQKFPNLSTRIVAAIDAGVDGIVIYDSWKTISLTTGDLNADGQEFKDTFTQYYFIENKQSGDRIKPYSNGTSGTLIVQAPSSYSGNFTQWEIVPTDNGYVRFRNRGSKMYFRPTNNNSYSNIYGVNSFSGTAAFVQWRIDDIDNTYSYVVNRSSGKKMRSINGNDLSTHSNESDIRINQVPSSWTGDATRWRFVEAN
ncbi:RICIN domain-containing protein [Flavivirga jejuensis]|uniref:RICIN domain-containing protein n=1 Tax=Flavivirga jejuensis TaxID=870487 RepID=A0ABT8WQF2_9FLAO|nr:RICIN domain-containing protein [Flavivirga jejuensis]MDO5975395.1 RICIN domain-containing protein [Flavivirga jejuensis]